jgi:ABC-type uncharacterized transport system substrate-binding protein
MRKAGVFSILFAVALLAVAVIAQAQQPKKIHRIGFIGASSSSNAGHHLEAFRQGLRDLHHIEGENIAIEVRWAEGLSERFPPLLAELLGLKVDVIVVSGATGALAAKKAAITTPVVFTAVTDPLGYGIIESLARPGGNITGVALAVGEGFSGKWVELLKEPAPRVTRSALLLNPKHPLAPVFQRETQAAGRAVGVKLDFFEARDPNELTGVLSRIEQRAEALIVTPDPLFGSQRARLVDLVMRRRLPSMFFYQEFADAGALMSYGPSWSDSYRRAAFYVDKVLKGAKPADLPVEQPTKFEFIINLKAAKQIGLTIPPNVLARADKVIK